MVEVLLILWSTQYLSPLCIAYTARTRYLRLSIQLSNTQYFMLWCTDINGFFTPPLLVFVLRFFYITSELTALLYELLFVQPKSFNLICFVFWRMRALNLSRCSPSISGISARQYSLYYTLRSISRGWIPFILSTTQYIRGDWYCSC